MTSLSEFKKQLLAREFQEHLDHKCVADDGTDIHEPAPWIVTIVMPDDTCQVGVLDIKDKMTTPELANWLNDGCQERGGTHGHATCPQTDAVIYFGTDANVMAEYVKAHMAMKRKADKKGFGSK